MAITYHRTVLKYTDVFEMDNKDPLKVFGMFPPPLLPYGRSCLFGPTVGLVTSNDIQSLCIQSLVFLHFSPFSICGSALAWGNGTISLWLWPRA